MSSKKHTKQKSPIKSSKSPKKKRSSTSNKPSNNSPPKNVKIASAYPTKIKSPSISFIYIIILLIIRISSALLNPIADCDETYNYWEPTTFLINNYGFQTWEYAPQYALRSYSYLIPQFLFAKLITNIPITATSPYIIFYSIRIFLSILCMLCELYFVKSITVWFGRRTAFITFIFMTFSSGMFNCCSAYLPQQFVICMLLLSFGAFFRNRRKTAILFMGTAIIIGWPFIVLLAIPMAIDCIVVMGLSMFIVWMTVFGAVLCGICIGVDYIYYGKILLAPLNIFIYNMHITGPVDDDGDDDGDGEGQELNGQNLYGVDDWKFYVKNLIFNWNIIYFLAMIAPITCNLIVLLFWNKKKRSKNRGRRARGMNCCEKMINLLKITGDANSEIVRRLLHCIVPFWCWYLFFMYMPHKEERFMFVIYPFIALNAALTLTQFRLIKIDENGTYFGSRLIKIDLIKFIISNINFAVIMLFIMLCGSRTIGQVMYYRAPLNIWYKAGEYIRSNDIGYWRKNICVGSEWYRIPSTLFVSDVANIRWIESGFDGQLPAEFEGTDVANQPFNDKNKGDKSRFVINTLTACDYIMDLWESNSVIDQYDVSKYEVIERVKFLDREATSAGIFRSFYIPILGDNKVSYANYVFLKRREANISEKNKNTQ